MHPHQDFVFRWCGLFNVPYFEHVGGTVSVANQCFHRPFVRQREFRKGPACDPTRAWLTRSSLAHRETDGERVTGEAEVIFNLALVGERPGAARKACPEAKSKGCWRYLNLCANSTAVRSAQRP